ncbi:MAG TPA: nucleoside triphosphate pyrophosphohydrolase [Dehalococcoidia bacterium]
MPPTSTSLVIVGLGPGDPAHLTLEAHDVLSSADEVWLRTARHPSVAGLPAGPHYRSFDDLYEAGSSFETVYSQIVERVLELAARTEGVVYAVPGHPSFGEATTPELLERCQKSDVAARVIPGVSFVDVAAPALGLDPLADGLLVVDALTLGGRGRPLVPQRPTLVAQIYDRRTASHAKLALLDVYPPDHPVQIVRAAGTDDETIGVTTLALLDHADTFDHLTCVFVPPIAPIDDVRTFEGLRAIVARLRAPDGGCPWDLEQTHESLKRFLIEEAYEALDALDAGDPARLAEELGDLLMQVVLHAQVAEDNAEFVIEDVLASIASKLVRRHPHVFGDVEVSGSQDVLRNWETLKGEERGDAPLLDAVPKAMPALAQAQSVQGRASKAGIAPDQPLLAAELARLTDPASTPDIGALGDVLFALVALARQQDIDAEEALRLSIARFRDEVAARETRRKAGTG